MRPGMGCLEGLGVGRLRRALFVVFVLAVTLLCVRLGLWQLDRAAQKRALLAADAAQTARLPLDLNVVEPTVADERRPVVARGRYETRWQFLLDNQVEQHQAGYQVLTPFWLSSRPGVAVLVNRGWVPQGARREVLPPVSVMDDERVLRGQWVAAPGVGLRLGSALGSSLAWPRVIQYVDWDALQLLWREANGDASSVRLLPWIIRLAPEAEDGFVRRWQVVSMGPEKHTGYAVQWFGVALASVVLLGVVLWRELKQPGRRAVNG
jgi:surfeit locus 1 family protein